MLHLSLGLSVFMLVSMIVCVLFLFTKLKLITPFNVAIYLVLAVFWVCLRIFGDQLLYQGQILGDKYVAPVAVGLSSFVQVIVRWPLAKLGQKIKSRKIPIVVAFGIFLALALPFIVAQNNITFILVALGTGVFAATFGMENLYFSENWSLKHVFITVALISLLPTMGIFGAAIVRNVYYETASLESLSGYANFMQWVLLAVLILSFIALFVYVTLNRERKNTIRKNDIYGPINSQVEALKLKNLLGMSCVILLIGLANQLIFRGGVAKIADNETWIFIYVLVSAFSVVTALLTSLVLVRHFRVKTIVAYSRIATLLGMTLGVVMWFADVNSVWMGGVFIFVFATAVTMYETTLIGAMVHFDQSNKMLVLAIWLTVRSLGYGVGDTVGGVLEVKYQMANDNNVGQWVALGGLAVIALVIALSSLKSIRAIDKLIYENVDHYENKALALPGKESIWKHQ